MMMKLIETMQSKFGSTYSRDLMPKFMKELCMVCKNPETHFNVRLFIAKLVINLPNLFEPYAKYVTEY
jgi:hypothetical protein